MYVNARASLRARVYPRRGYAALARRASRNRARYTDVIDNENQSGR